MKSILKKIIILLMILFVSNAFAVPAFDGFVSGSLTTAPKGISGLTTEATGLLASQLYLNNSFVLRSEFNVVTEDLLNNIFQNSTVAKFTIQELSATFRFNADTVNQHLSLYIGDFESFGSDAFVKKYFNVNNFSSPVQKSDLKTTSASMYDFTGIGFAYTIKLQSPTAFGIYTHVGEESGLKNLNADIRYAKKWDSAVLDIGFGVTLPMEKKDSAGKKVFLMIDHAVLHGGFSLLLGNNPITNLFLQVGLIQFQTKPTSGIYPVSIKDLYFFVEPRFTTNYFKCNVAFFFLPDNTIKNLQQIENNIGCSIALESLDFNLFNKNANAGLNTTASFPSDVLTPTADNLDIQINAYSQIQVFSGSMGVSLQVNPKKFADLSKFINFTIGYKTAL